MSDNQTSGGITIHAGPAKLQMLQLASAAVSDTPTESMLDDRIAELEDENAALRAALRLNELERENAALRADRERLLYILQRWLRMADEWYAEADQYGFGEPNITAGMINDTRDAIDSAQNEAQP